MQCGATGMTAQKTNPARGGVCFIGADPRLPDHALLAGAALKATTTHAEGERQLAYVEPRVTRQNHRRRLRILRKAELALADDLRAALVLHNVAAGISRVIDARGQLLAARSDAFAVTA